MKLPLRHTVIVSLAILLLAACAPASEETPAAETTQTADAAPMRIASIDGFSTPESVVYDSEQDVYYVSNIIGNPSVADNNGFISRMRADGTVDSLRFILGGRSGVALHAPKGMAIIAETLWVSDIDAIQAFNKRTGAAVATINLRGRVKFLNDVAAGPDGVLYVTGLPNPADIGFDTRRGRVAVPLFMDNRVELWEIR